MTHKYMMYWNYQRLLRKAKQQKTIVFIMLKEIKTKIQILGRRLKEKQEKV